MRIPTWDQVRQRCLQSEIGKRLPDALYVHQFALDRLDHVLQEVEALARSLAQSPGLQTKTPWDWQPTLIKFSLKHPVLSYLEYPNFDRDAHPALRRSLQVKLSQGTVQQRQYSDRSNPPILHRKETFVGPQYPNYDRFAWLTQQEEALGLLDKSSQIGTKNGWEQRLQALNLEITDHTVVCPIPWINNPSSSLSVPLAPSPSSPSAVNLGVPSQSTLDLQEAHLVPSIPTISPQTIKPQNTRPQKVTRFSPVSESQDSNSQSPEIQRHRAAIQRSALSRPLRLAMEAGLLPVGYEVFDYGCGRGGDVDRLRQAGYRVSGWDPYYQTDTPCLEADLVNLGYIINVIENEAERREALLKAWSLARQILLVAAQVVVEDARHGSIAYGDGVITQRNTFQKYYEQDELKHYIDQVLGVDAIPLGLGIYSVFRDPQQAEQFRASRFRSRAKTPRVRSSVRRFEAFQALLEPLMAFYSDRGRLPNAAEIAVSSELQAIQTQFTSLKQAFNLILKATNPQDWQDLEEQRRQDWLVYLALGNFGTRPRFKDLNPGNQGDIKALFGSYRSACDRADLMLHSIGHLDHIHNACHQYQQRTGQGQLQADSLWLHVDLRDTLDPLLRLYEGCGAQTFGRLDGGNILRIHWTQAAVTYYEVPDFETQPHPILRTAMKLDFRRARVRYKSYDRDDDPPVLVRKDQLVSPEHPQYSKFLKFSQQEYRWGILADWSGPDRYWRKQSLDGCLHQQGAELQGHRLVWRKDLADYQRKLLLSQQRARTLPPSPMAESI